MHLRYPKNQPLLLTNVKKCRLGGILKERLGVTLTSPTDGRERGNEITGRRGRRPLPFCLALALLGVRSKNDGVYGGYIP